MVRTIAALIAFGLLTVSAAAQPSFGVKAGLALTDQDFDYRDFDVDFDSRTGVQVGLFADFAFNDYLRVSPEVRYVPVGVKTKVIVTEPEYPEGTGERTIKSRIDYLSMPVVVKIGYPAEKFFPYLIVGPRVDFQLGTDGDWFAAIYEDLDKVAFGLTVGGGVEIPLSPKYRLLAEFSYSPDLNKVYENDLLSVKNKTMSFLAGVRF